MNLSIMRKFFPAVLPILAAFTLALPGCGQDGDADAPLTVQLNWKAEPQFGGFYAAAAAPDARLQIKEGGAGIATIDMATAGTVPFAVVSGDELVIARSRGKDVVALLAVYQTNPQGLMTRANRGLTSIDQIFEGPGTLAIEQGLPYAQFLKKKYGFDKLKVIPSPFGDLTGFRTQDDYAMQCFVTSEPLTARKAGLDPAAFLIADAGWNPYTTVLVTRGRYLKDHPQAVAHAVEVIRDGWTRYLRDPEPTNVHMATLNPTMDAQTFTDSAKAQQPLIETPAARTDGIGSMTRERWQTLIDQLADLGLIDQKPDAQACFVQPESN